MSAGQLEKEPFFRYYKARCPPVYPRNKNFVKIKTLHFASLLVGSLFLGMSLVQAIFYNYPNFYTSFSFGSWLVLDWLDWRLNKSSILAYFFNHRHRDAFVALFFIATVFCFLVDYVYGVRLAKMWTWTDYGTIGYVRMYLFMNLSYILGMYELFRVVRSLLSRTISTAHIIHLRIAEKNKHLIFEIMIALGVIFFLMPLYALLAGTDKYVEYIMIFPFTAMILVSDGLNGLLGGPSFFLEMIRVNKLQMSAIVLTVAIAAGVTETINIFGGEWRYLRMPFPGLNVGGIPAAVFIGWIPLIIGVIAVVNFIRHADLVWDNRRKIEKNS
ncbi:hypothetical protein D4R52_00405 [bacterium]|nr:MAG: hypothetical protein D4R52_00405 [bacterium]